MNGGKWRGGGGGGREGEREGGGGGGGGERMERKHADSETVIITIGTIIPGYIILLCLCV